MELSREKRDLLLGGVKQFQESVMTDEDKESVRNDAIQAAKLAALSIFEDKLNRIKELEELLEEKNKTLEEATQKAEERAKKADEALAKISDEKASYSLVPSPGSQIQPHSDWVEMHDPETNATYYFNNRTHATSWHLPTENDSSSGYETSGSVADYDTDFFDESSASENEEDGGEEDEGNFEKQSEIEWEEYYDDEAQAKYWYNKETGEASWTMPPEVEAEQKGGGKGEWVSYMDEESGKEYWYNTATGETNWDGVPPT